MVKLTWPVPLAWRLVSSVSILSMSVFLILDEWLLLKPTDSEQRDIFELLHRRRKKSSTIFCSQYEFEEWYDNITSIDAERDRSKREVYGLDKALCE